jgi:hypothetical protein
VLSTSSKIKCVCLRTIAGYLVWRQVVCVFSGLGRRRYGRRIWRGKA